MMMTLKYVSRIIFLAGIAAIFFHAADLRDQASAGGEARVAPIDDVKNYLRAIHARDAATVYRHISSVDRMARDERTYIRSQENFTGFALDLAKRLAADMEVWVIEQKLGTTTARLEVGYRLPTGDEISPQLLDWNPDRLNALSAPKQAALAAAWEKVKKSGKAVTIESRETFDLVRESDGWKIFLGWRSRHRVVFKTSRQTPTKLAVKFLRNDLLVKNEEPFQVDVRVTNRTDRALVVKLNHLFAPQRMEKNLDMIACGSLAPFRLLPHETQEVSSAYLVRGTLPAKAPFAIIYDFNLVRQPELSQSQGATAR